MHRLPISNRELERVISKQWHELLRARREHRTGGGWHERLMNQALDELCTRLESRVSSSGRRARLPGLP